MEASVKKKEKRVPFSTMREWKREKGRPSFSFIFCSSFSSPILSKVLTTPSFSRSLSLFFFPSSFLLPVFLFSLSFSLFPFYFSLSLSTFDKLGRYRYEMPTDVQSRKEIKQDECVSLPPNLWQCFSHNWQRLPVKRLHQPSPLLDGNLHHLSESIIEMWKKLSGTYILQILDDPKKLQTFANLKLALGAEHLRSYKRFLKKKEKREIVSE